MEIMDETFKNIVVLVDADNTQYSKMQAIIQKISTFGRIVVKRVYGNWKKDILKNWENEIKEYALNPRQQFDYVSGKNATDMALVIDAMELMYTGRYDAFVIVSSDSDYTPLNIKLRENGYFVIGVGRKTASEAFKRSCDDFIDIEILGSTASKEVTDAEENEIQQDVEEQKETEEEKKESSQSDNNMTEAELHKLLKVAAETESYQDDEGFVNVSSAGTYIKRVRPDFDIQIFGVKKLPEFIKKYPDMYEMTKYRGKGKVNIVAYKSKQIED